MILLRRLLGILFHPKRTFAEISDDRDLWRTLLHCALVLLPPTALLVIGGLIVYPLYIAPLLGDKRALGWLSVVFLAPFVLVPALVGLAAEVLILQPFVLLFGGRRGISQTVRAVVYASTPTVLTFWFPPIVGFTVMWSLVLTIVGLRQTQGLSTARAILAVFVPLTVLTGSLLAVGLAASR